MERRSYATGHATGREYHDADDVFDALDDATRRQVLVGLLDDEPHTVSPLSEAAGRLLDAHQGLLDQYLAGTAESPDVDRELLRERSVHLPKLSDYGFADWDQDADVVTQGPRFHVIRPFLELLESPGAGVRPPALDARRPGLPTADR